MSHELVITSGRQVGYGQIALGVGVALLGIGAAILLMPRRRPRLLSGQRKTRLPPTVAAGRSLNQAAGMLAASVLADSAIEHYRGSFHNRAMVTPLVVAPLTLAASAHGLVDRRRQRHRWRGAVSAAALLTGLVGSGFHFYNVAVRPGGFGWQNLFYGAPLGAPAAIALAGLMGAAAERLRDTLPSGQPRLVGLPAGRVLAALAAIGLAGTMGEAGLLHFRGAWHNPFMLLPVTLPGAAALLLMGAALGRPRRPHLAARWLLRLTAAMGVGGTGFHAYGVHRNMGGWGNWKQTLLNGPPLPAPPSFTGLALAGLGAVALIEEQGDA